MKLHVGTGMFRYVLPSSVLSITNYRSETLLKQACMVELVNGNYFLAMHDAEEVHTKLLWELHNGSK